MQLWFFDKVEKKLANGKAIQIRRFKQFHFRMSFYLVQMAYTKFAAGFGFSGLRLLMMSEPILGDNLGQMGENFVYNLLSNGQGY